MGIIDPNATGRETDGKQVIWWNYTNPSKPNYCPSLTGDVVLIETPQEREFGSNEPMYMVKKMNRKTHETRWVRTPEYDLPENISKDDYFPLTVIRLTLVTAMGNEAKFEFKPGSAKRPSNVAVAIGRALGYEPEEKFNLTELGGKNITIETGTETYSISNPRPWKVTINGDADQGNPFQGLRDLATIRREQASYRASSEEKSDAGGTSTDDIYDEDIPF